METERLDAERGIGRAAELLRAGELVAFPTETVYGLGADARNDRAVARVFEAKRRPRFNPLIVHVADEEAARDIAQFSERAASLAGAFWPGALTLVLPLQPEAGLSPLVTAGHTSVAVRVPKPPLSRALLAEVGGPVAAPSANPSGKVSPTRAEHVLEGLGGRIAAVLDGGACPVGVESTIVGLTEQPVLLRPGGLPVEALEDALREPLLQGSTDPDAPVAPGQLASHYATEAPIRMNAHAPQPDEVFLGFGPGPGALVNLSPSGDLVEAAAALFGALRTMDATSKGRRIAVAPIPDHGLGRAINDRLRRAAAPRP